MKLFIILSNTNSLISKAIKFTTDCIYTHVSFGVSEAPLDINTSLISALPHKGVFEGHFFDIKNEANDILVFENDIDPDIGNDVMNNARSYIGAKYDYKAILRLLIGRGKNDWLNDADRWFCSELAYACLKHTHVINNNVYLLLDIATITPRDFLLLTQADKQYKIK